MSDAGPVLDRTAIERASRRLGERPAGRVLTADVYVIGGAALARRTTHAEPLATSMP